MSEISIERFVAAPDRLEAFERVRDMVGIYSALGSEPVAEGVACFVAWRGEIPVARVSAQVVQDLHGAPGPSGLVGHYEALRQDAGIAVLEAACRTLAAASVARVLGPINGSTWARYRLALRPSPEAGPVDWEDDPDSPRHDPPPFLAEPWNPPRYPADFAAAGFVAEARYESRVSEHLAEDAPGTEKLAESVRAAGVGVRPLDLARFEDELTGLFELSLAAFADNLFYTPIGLDAFRDQYRRVRPLIEPELALVAEDSAGRPVAFMFAFRDPMSPPDAPPRVVAKTIATIPAMRGLGLGGLLFDRIHQRAHALGCGSVIHALIHLRNLSMKMSARHRSRPFRRYVLYRWAP